MLFNSWEFGLLAIITFILYYLPQLRSIQVILLILASFVFYGFGQPHLLLLLVLSILINAIASHRVAFGAPAHRLKWAWIGVGVNLGVLLFFKYSGLIYRSTLGLDVMGGGSHSIDEFFRTLPLPVGISFFTFQGISLIVDAYRSQKSGQHLIELDPSFKKHLVTIAFFKSFFPQLVAGPIVKAHEFLPQVRHKALRDLDWLLAFRSLILGYFLKMVVADQLRDHTFWMTYPYFNGLSSVTLLALLFAYSMQIFADFAGYSLIAIGLAALFGYCLPINFDFPYIATSFSEFWRRWHISLSTWLKEYLYLPLGGNRKGHALTYFNLFITMFLGGLWHGAAWSYAIWGTWHGLLLAMERAITPRGRKSSPQGFLFSGLKMSVVFGLVTLGWLLFRLPEFYQVILYLKAIFNNTHFHNNNFMIFHILIYSVPVLAYHILALLRSARGIRLSFHFEALVYGIMLFLIFTNSGTPGAFIYFQF